MPVTKPGTLPRWSEEAGGTQHNITPAPSSGRQDVGWLPDDEVLAQWMNWWMNLVYRWTAYLNDLENQALTWVGIQTFSARPIFSDGILVNAPTTGNRPGVDSTGNGTGAGIKGTGGSSNGFGLDGVGIGSGAGVRGTGGTTGAGVSGVGGASGGTGISGIGTAGGTAGVAGTGGPSTGIGVTGTGTGSGAGVTGVGGASNAPGMNGQGGGSGAGVFAQGGSSNGIGVDSVGVGTGQGGRFQGGTSGYGVECSGNSTRAPLRIVPLSADPSTALEGDTYVNSTTHKLRVYLNGTWVDQT